MIDRVQILVMFFGLGLLTAVEAIAGTGVTYTVPDARTVPRSGLKITLGFDGCSMNGLRPIQVTIRPIAGVFRRDRDIQIDLGVGNYQRSEFVASKTFRVQKGEVSYQDFVYVPIRLHSMRATVDTYEDGQRLRDLCVSHLDIGISNGSRSISPPAILALDFDAPVTGKLQSAAPSSDGKLPDLRGVDDDIRKLLLTGRYGETVTEHDFDDVLKDSEILRLISNTSYIDIANPTEFHDEWIAMSGVDIVLLSWSDLQRMKTELPKRWDALHAWAFAGGNLVIYGAGSEFAELEAIEEFFKLTPVDRDAEYLGWDRRAKIDQRLDINSFTGHGTDIPTKAGDSNFVVRDIGMGKIAAISDEFPFPGDTRRWSTLLNTLPSSWEQRHGVSWNAENGDYWNFVLAGLGLAPVNLFRIWIVIFVLAIGPVNYFLLKRTNRLSWMLMTVPLAALLTTLGLFAYALVTDGLGVRYRVRSVTHIDQNSGMAATWSRQVYYAGIAPSDGLSFPRDSVTIPILQSPNLEFSTNERHIRWLDGEQRLGGGYMQSRVMSQFLVIRSRATPLRLDVQNEGDVWTVTNQLGAEVKEIYLVADDGTRFGSEAAVKAGEKTTLVEKPDPISIEQRLSRLLNECPLRVPDGIDVSAVRDLAQMNGSYYYYYNGQNSIVSTATSLLEKHITAATKPARANSSKTISKFFSRPRTYVAVVDGCAEVPIGVEGEEQDSIYIVTGTW